MNTSFESGFDCSVTDGAFLKLDMIAYPRHPSKLQKPCREASVRHCAKLLFIPQCSHRIDLESSASRDVTRQQSYQGQEQHNHPKSYGVRSTNSEQEA